MDAFAASLGALAAGALAGAPHCAGMCGGFAALAAGRRPLRVAAYLGGKFSTYVLLGALAGAAGGALTSAAPFGIGERVLAIVSGILLLVAALDAFGLLRLGPLVRPGVLNPLGQLAAEGAPGALLIGALNGLLPCPISFGFVGVAALSGSVLHGAAIMAVLGLVSALPLSLCGVVGTRIARWRLFPPRAGAVVMVVLAALTIYRGIIANPAKCPFHP